MLETAPPTTPPPAHSARWWALSWISLTQLMMVVVSTVMNIAVPSAQADLGLTDTQRQWVITIYLLAFGALLLLGGRVADTIGRRRALLIGLAGFTLASILGGLAPNPETLLAARALQGVFSALIAPAALALMSLTFPAGPDRAKAFGIFGTIMGAGSGVGVVVGGILTDSWGWRSAMFINVPIALAAAIGLLIALPADPAHRGRVDLLGGALSALGLTALTLGFTSSETSGWTAPATLGLFAVGTIALLGFVWRQHRAPAPLMPLTLFAERRRSAAFLAMLSWGIAIMPVFLFLSVFLQQIVGLTPLLSGLAFLPYTLAILVTVRAIRPLQARVAPRVLISAGLLVIATALVLLSLLHSDASWMQVLPVLPLLGIGTASVQPTAQSAATYQAGPASGAAGAVASTAQQVGSSLGMALLGSVAATATAAAAGAGHTAGASVVAGFATAGGVGAAILATAAVVTFVVAGRDRAAVAR